MPATPAWPPKSAPRLFVDRDLSAGGDFPLDPAHARYLLAVMRKGEGDVFRAFDDRTGEYSAELREAGKGKWAARVGERIAAREDVPDLWLCLSPIQRDNFALVAEKACELGVRKFQPVEMHRTVVRQVNDSRLHARMVGAAEQCERTALPEIAPMVRLERLLADWPQDRALFFCDERGGSPARVTMEAHPGPAAILIGPEGGFDDAENAAIRAVPQAIPISLGPRILRAETAAMAAIALWMGTVGDWKD
ncbi:Ribosomal RNA small subunit methyltransferase E [Tsuneonella dongtanensis]|uniref:Ribosomal RNA small subunit methyltransferase E n=1 Tax=Tsuneonella dongtanensis TaxID=692370 RepID=A0A1B2AGS2_9SPHN|nr:16S rRNA (uracil(1498)-N(3))-methyltransferase [Tsuneonella dongtanensis]ANY21235.1 Ribosomal RNA small subunit methyltransferase E [Tsuneonella dongtanensis]